MQRQSVSLHSESRELSRKSRRRTRCDTSAENSERRKQNVTRSELSDRKVPPKEAAMGVTVADVESHTILHTVRKHPLVLAMTLGRVMLTQTPTLPALSQHHQSATMGDEKVSD